RAATRTSSSWTSRRTTPRAPSRGRRRPTGSPSGRSSSPRSRPTTTAGRAARASTTRRRRTSAAASVPRPCSPTGGGPSRSTAVMAVNYAAIPVRPAGAGWSSVNDMLKYVAMELASGRLPDGERYIGEAALLERRKPKVPVSEDHYYGMGLMVDEYYGTPVVHHGGDLIGYHSDMMWLPEHGVGAVVLTNGDPGWLIRGHFRRKLLEVLFDGKPDADAQHASNAETVKAAMAKEFELLSVPGAKDRSAALAAHYRNDVLGDIRVTRANGRTTFDFGGWQSEVGSRETPDGTTSFMTIVPGPTGLEFVVGEGEEKTLVMRDAQHEYVFDAI